MELIGDGISKIEISSKWLGATTMIIDQGDTLSIDLGGYEPISGVAEAPWRPWNFKCIVHDNIDNLFPGGMRPLDYLQVLGQIQETAAFAITLRNGSRFIANGILEGDVSASLATNTVTFGAVGL